MPISHNGIFPRTFGISTGWPVGSIVNIYPYLDQVDTTLGSGGSWLTIQFPPHNDGGILLPKLIYNGNDATSVTSGIGIIPGGHIFKRTNVGLAMCLKIQ